MGRHASRSGSADLADLIVDVGGGVLVGSHSRLRPGVRWVWEREGVETDCSLCRERLERRR